MSREHRKNLKRGEKHPLVEREQRVRTSRHGKPHTMRVDGKQVPVVAPFKVRVAAGPTGSIGQPNTGGTKAGKKSAGPPVRPVR